MNNTEITNLVSLSGTIVGKYETTACHVFILAITEPTRRRTGEVVAQTNYPRVYFFKQDNTGAEKFDRGDHVDIVAHVAAPRKTRPGSDRTYYSQSIIGESIKATESNSLVNEVLPGRSAVKAENIVYLKGEVERVERVAPNVNLITMSAYNKRFYNRVQFTSYDATTVAIVPGNTIVIEGKIRTSERDGRNGEKRRFQNIVARTVNDLGVVPRKDDNRIDYKAEKAAAMKEANETQPLDI